MQELIERLRHGYPSAMRLQAADAIEKQAAEIERKDAALRVALERLEEVLVNNQEWGDEPWVEGEAAITAVKEAL